MNKTYRGACHCGRVQFEVDADINYIVDCNCSICRRKGALWHAAPESAVRIVSGEEDLALYQFNTMTARHYFCRTCGIHPLTRPRIDPTRWVVNVRCLEDVDLSALPVRTFDGEHWEDAARALLAKRGKQPA